MRTYYRGPDARVTDQHFIRRTPGTEVVFCVRDLRNVQRIQRGSASDRTGGIVVTAVGLVALTAASWAVVGPAAGYAIAAGAVLAGLVVLAATRRNARRWQVRATYRGAEVIVYTSADQQTFNQVTRALRRAIEDSRPTREAHGLAAA